MTTETQLNSNEIIDNLGRKIKLKEITGKTRIAFYRSLGARDSANMGVVNEYWNVMAVDSIDDSPAYLKSLVDIEHIYNQLEKGNAFALVQEWLDRKYEEKIASEKEERDLKKG